MIKKMKSKKIVLLRYLLIVPIISLLSLEYSCDRNEQQTVIMDEVKIIGFATFDSPADTVGVHSLQGVEKFPAFFSQDMNKEKDEIYSDFANELRNHIVKYFNYPEQAKKEQLEGRTIVGFVINEEGIVTEPSIVRGSHEILDNEALRIVNKIPQMNPAMVDGKRVRVSFMLPITFKLDKKVKKEESSLNFLNEKKSPLFVVDGEFVDKSKLEEIDPKSIDAMNVLKDEAATSVYGDKGKNGVIVITLKK
jgi:TonB family protein